MTRELNRITYIEDEPDIRDIAEIALTNIGGFEVNLCSSAEQAIEEMPKFRPDLILLDVMMPSLDGMQTIRVLKVIPELADTPVIFMTARVQKHEIKVYKDLGAIDVIPKPFDPLTLAMTIRQIWEQRVIGEAA